jgi:hypothetical protein
MEIQLSEHVKTEMLRRHLPEEWVKQVACRPEQTLPARNGLECRQSKIFDPSSGKDYLLRVIVNPHESPNVVVTAYKTSKLSKYWSE